jgi:hypothetical protein
MIKAVFRTLAEARAAGWTVPPRGKVLRRYRGYEIRIVDTSGHPYYGYSFAVKAMPPLDDPHSWMTLPLVEGEFASTADVILTDEPNRAGFTGASLAMFPPGELEAGIQRAIAAIDRVLDIEGRRSVPINNG